MIFLYYLLRNLCLISWLFYDSSLTPWFMTHSWHIHDTFMTHSWQFPDTFMIHSRPERARERHNSGLNTHRQTDRQTQTHTHTHTNTHTETIKWHTGLFVGAKNVTDERVLIWYGKHKNCWRWPLCCSIMSACTFPIPGPWGWAGHA